MKLQFSLLALVVLFAFGLHAETQKPVVKKKTTITTTITESEGDDDETPASAPETTTGVSDDNEITTTFGSTATTGMAGCKTEELSQNVIKDLKSDCSAWMKDQKSHLKDKFVTGTCEEQCSDCQMNLRRCVVKGTVRYSKAAPPKK